MATWGWLHKWASSHRILCLNSQLYNINKHILQPGALNCFGTCICMCPFMTTVWQWRPKITQIKGVATQLAAVFVMVVPFGEFAQIQMLHKQYGILD